MCGHVGMLCLATFDPVTIATGLQAAAKHEQAAELYSHTLQLQSGQHQALSKEGKAFLVDRCCEAYAAVADWQGLQQWLQDLQVSNADTGSM